MEYKALGRYLFVKKLNLEIKSKFKVDDSDDETVYFSIHSAGEDVTSCKAGDKVILRPGNYEPVPLFGSEKGERLYIAEESDVVGVLENA